MQYMTFHAIVESYYLVGNYQNLFDNTNNVI